MAWAPASAGEPVAALAGAWLSAGAQWPDKENDSAGANSPSKRAPLLNACSPGAAGDRRRPAAERDVQSTQWPATCEGSPPRPLKRIPLEVSQVRRAPRGATPASPTPPTTPPREALAQQRAPAEVSAQSRPAADFSEQLPVVPRARPQAQATWAEPTAQMQPQPPAGPEQLLGPGGALGSEAQGGGGPRPPSGAEAAGGEPPDAALGPASRAGWPTWIPEAPPLGSPRYVAASHADAAMEPARYCGEAPADAEWISRLPDAGSEVEQLRRRFSALSGALQRSNSAHSELQGLLGRALDRCDALQLEGAEASQASDLHHQRWRTAGQELEELRAEEARARDGREADRRSSAQARQLLQGQLDELRAERAESREAREADRLECQALRRRLGELQAEESASRQAREGFQRRWRALEGEQGELERVCERLRAARSEAERARDRNHEELAAGRREGEALRLRCGALQAEEAEESQQRRAAGRERDELQQRCAELWAAGRDALQARDEHYQKLRGVRREHRAMLEQRDALVGEAVEVRRMCEQHQQRRRTLERGYEELQRECGELQEARREAAQARDDHHQDLLVSRQELQSLLQQHRALQLEERESQALRGRSRQRRGLLEDECAQLQQDRVKLRTECGEAEQSQLDHQHRLRAFNEELAALRHQLEAAQREEQRASGQRDAHAESWRSCARECEELQRERGALRAEEAEARSARSAERGRLRAAGEELQALRQSLGALRSERAEARRASEEEEHRQLRAFGREREELQQQCSELRAKEEEARQRHDQHEQRWRASGKDLEALREQCQALQAEEAEARQARDHHHRRWCVVDQEREALQRVAQQAQASGRAARSAEAAALEEAAAWRRWLASFLDVLLRRGAAGLAEGGVSQSQSLQSGHPQVHLLLTRLAQVEDKPVLEPELLSQLPALYDSVSEDLARGDLAVRWDSGQCQDDELRRSRQSEERAAHLERQLSQKELTVAALEHDRRTLRSEVRSLQNLVQDLRGSIRVFCRLRPPRRAPAPADGGAAPSEATPALGARVGSTQSVLLRKPPGDREQDFGFDRVFGPDAGQRDLYEEVEPLLPGILRGLHLCVFAYGQTGSGKTYTLSGRPGGEGGLQDLALADLLRLVEAHGGGAAYDAWLSALEIYNETVQDLLASLAGRPGPGGAVEPGGAEPGGARLEVRQSREGAPDGEGVAAPPSPFGSMRIPGLHMQRVVGHEDVDQALRLVLANRHVASTALNERSSRSHCVVSLTLLKKSTGTAGVLHVVDLAGSERTKVSQAEGQQMKEANCINRSLSALSDVLFALGDPCGSAHVPYRNSKLTYLLQDALGGSGCKTFLFAQISPEPAEVHESYSTMTFATRVAACVQKGRLRLPSASLAAERSPAAAREKTPPRTPGRAGGALAHGGPPRGTPPPAPCGASPPSRLSDCSLAAASPQTRRGSTAAAPPGARRAGAALALETPDRRPRFHA